MLESIDLRQNSKLIRLLVFATILAGFGGYWFGLDRSGTVSVEPNQEDLSSTNFNDRSDSEISKINQIQEINQNVRSHNTDASIQSDAYIQALDTPSNEFPIVYGSVNGTKYYNYGCKSGNRIKPENRLYFENETEALLSGYEPSVNCDF